jgi:cytochrome c-type biogenesis protein CcmE
MSPRKKKMLTLALVVAGLAIATALILTAFEKNLMYFYSPSEIAMGDAPENRPFRIGGMVVKGSVVREKDTLGVWFNLTDYANERMVYYKGILPDLFREGQGIVAKGGLNETGLFVATEVLAKHDENYMPPEVADALKKSQKYKNSK